MQCQKKKRDGNQCRARTIYRVIGLPTHLDRASWRWRSAQYIKAMDASFPSDRWPATEVTEPDGTHRLVLKDRTEISRVEPTPIYNYHSHELAGFDEGYPPGFRAIAVIASRRGDWEQPANQF